MYHVRHHPRQSIWARLCILFAVFAALSSVRPARTANSIRLVKDINPAGESSLTLYPEFTALGNTLLFSANDGVHGWELWKSDGTGAGTRMVKDINTTGDSSLYGLTMVGDTLLFFADDGVHGAELWRSDGTEAGTTLVKDINLTGQINSSVYALSALGDTLFFRADDGVHGMELWASDGSEAGTKMVKDINPTSGGDSNTYNLTAVGDTLFFTATDGVHGAELWKSDGSEVGTKMIKDIRPGSEQSFGFTPSFAIIGNTLFFSPADDGVHGPELWRSDGTETGTILVKDIRPGSIGGWGYPWWLTNVAGTLFFNADDGVHGNELWRSDGTETGTILVKDIYPHTNNTLACSPFALKDSNSAAPASCPPPPPPPPLPSSDPAFLTAMGGTLFFHADDGVHGREFWMSDGTEAGTTMLKDINLGSGSGLPPVDRPELTVVSQTLFFAADDGIHGVEPWASDGTAAGTMLIRDINSGSGGSYPYEFTRIGTTLFFSAATPETGHELWAMELPYHIEVPYYQVYLPLMRW
jgi:ELWxxDGT repeat protein